MKVIYNSITYAATTATDEDADAMVQYCGYQYENPRTTRVAPKEEVKAEVVKRPLISRSKVADESDNL